MTVKQIAASVLVLYATICLAIPFHNHLTEKPGDQCSICQILHAPGQAPTISSYNPVMIVQGLCQTFVQPTARIFLASSNSERAPPPINI